MGESNEWLVLVDRGPDGIQETLGRMEAALETVIDKTDRADLLVLTFWGLSHLAQRGLAKDTATMLVTKAWEE